MVLFGAVELGAFISFFFTSHHVAGKFKEFGLSNYAAWEVVSIRYFANVSLSVLCVSGDLNAPLLSCNVELHI